MLEHSAILGIVRADVLEFEMNLDVMALLRLCDPAIGIDSEDEFKAFWATARSHIDVILNLLSFASTPDRRMKNPPLNSLHHRIQVRRV